MVILILFLIFELYLLNRILKYFLLSPIYLYIIFATLSIVLSVLYFYFFENKYSLYNLDKVSNESFISTIKLYLLALVSFVLAVIVYYDLSKKRVKRLYNKSFSKSLFIKYKIPPLTTIVVKVLFVLIGLLYLLTFGDKIFIRELYLPETNRGLMVIIKIVSFLEVILLGIIYHKHKLTSGLLFSILILISIGTGSRVVFLFLLVYLGILFISSGNTLLNKVRFTFHLIFSFVFLAYLMPLRSLESHGIIPYLESIFTMNDHFLSDFGFNIYYSLIFGVFVTVNTIQEADSNWNIIFVSLNPLPGSIAGWYNYVEDMRLNTFAPYSLHGRVFSMGFVFTSCYFFITGLIFSFMEKMARSYLESGKRALSFVITLLLLLHIVYGFEYNLRSAFRYIYYTFFIILIVYLFKLLKPYLIAKK